MHLMTIKSAWIRKKNGTSHFRFHSHQLSKTSPETFSFLISTPLHCRKTIILLYNFFIQRIETHCTEYTSPDGPKNIFAITTRTTKDRDFLERKNMTKSFFFILHTTFQYLKYKHIPSSQTKSAILFVIFVYYIQQQKK